MAKFTIQSDMKPQGDQPQAIERLAAGLFQDKKFQTLLGVTGSGKTFTMANVIAEVWQGLTLVISHNKTLAAQLYEEFKELFPENAVEYFVSYYDFYQPEAYIPQRDIYIEKDSAKNDDLDRLRLSTTTSLLTREDVIIVASVSCIFGLGSPEDYERSVVGVRDGETVDRNQLLGRFADIQYVRNDFDFHRGTFRVRGDVVELHPSYESFAVRIEFFGDEIEKIHYINPPPARYWPRRSRFLYIPPSITSCRKTGCNRPLTASRPSLKTGCVFSSRKANCSKLSDCRHARCTTLK